MQLILVAIVIFWPQSVTYWLKKGPEVDLNTIKIEVPGFGGNGLGTPPGMPGLALPPMNGLPGQPPAQPKPAQPDLSQPPVIK
jgi:hypothetical protein